MLIRGSTSLIHHHLQTAVFIDDHLSPFIMVYCIVVVVVFFKIIYLSHLEPFSSASNYKWHVLTHGHRLVSWAAGKANKTRANAQHHRVRQRITRASLTCLSMGSSAVVN